MKRLLKKTKGLIRGVPSAVLLSAAIHLILLSVAGGLVVFTAIKKTEKKFVPPPPVERPKMELIKPKVKVKKNVKSGSTQRIVSKAPASMPDMQLPALEGMGKGLGSGIAGFDMMPDTTDISLFGGAKSMAIGNDFEGTFYSLSLDRRMKKTGIDRGRSYEIIRTFIESGWNPYSFSAYYRSPKKLYTTQFMIPLELSACGPDAFGYDDPNFPAYHWVVHYKGKIASRKDGRFRFWASADDCLIIRVNGKVLLDASRTSRPVDATGWKSSDKMSNKYELGNSHADIGDWFELKAETPVEMEVVIYENDGSNCFLVLIEDADEDYPESKEGMPVLPVFKTAEITGVTKTEIEYGTVRGQFDLDSQLMFNVH